MDAAPSARRSRREFLALAASAVAGGIVVACGGDTGADPKSDSIASDPLNVSAELTGTPRPTATARLVPPAGVTTRALLPGTPWETVAHLVHSGVDGPRVVILGGVHGNEPGGWLAAEMIARWEVDRGSLIVVPRANRVATELLERTRPELGDLNRLYPGGAEAELPMERMAHAIIELAREFDAELLLDLHESWAFYVERTMRGTAFIGQTITAATGPRSDTLAFELAEAVNQTITIERDRMVPRDRNFRSSDDENLPMQPNIPGVGQERRGSSSLSLGEHVPGLTPVLIEMGQQDQSELRRSELHQLVVRAALGLYGVRVIPA